MKPMLTATNLHKSYRRDRVVVPVLRGLNLDVRQGEFLSVIGASGSAIGSSTSLANFRAASCSAPRSRVR